MNNDEKSVRERSKRYVCHALTLSLQSRSHLASIVEAITWRGSEGGVIYLDLKVGPTQITLYKEQILELYELLEFALRGDER